MTSTASSTPTIGTRGSLRTPVAWGVVVGGIQVASPLAFPRLDTATVYALGLTLIAAVYIGFAVADGRRHVLVAEVAVASIFVVLAAAAATTTKAEATAVSTARTCRRPSATAKPT